MSHTCGGGHGRASRCWKQQNEERRAGRGEAVQPTAAPRKGRAGRMGALALRGGGLRRGGVLKNKLPEKGNHETVPL